jgi:hypothetical protein
MGAGDNDNITLAQHERDFVRKALKGIARRAFLYFI